MKKPRAAKPPVDLQPKTFFEFRKDATLLQCVYIRHGALSIYLRNCLNGKVDFVIANMRSDQPGGGHFRRFLDFYEPHFSFMIECCLNRRLEKFMVARGYVTSGDPYCPHIMLPNPVHHSVWIKTSAGFIRNPTFIHELLPDEEANANAVPIQDEPVPEDRSAEVYSFQQEDGSPRRRREQRRERLGLPAV